MDIIAFITIAFFVFAFVIISTERISKTITALLCGFSFIIFHIVGQEEAFRHVDWNVVLLLTGMMIIVGITKSTGLFQFLAIKTAKMVRGDPMAILILLSMLTGVLSALLDNVTTVLILTPISILIAVELGVSPLPYVISGAISSNIGGTATLVGDPPNIMIGSSAGFGFLDFLLNMGLAVVLIYPFFCLAVFLLFRKSLRVSAERRARIMEFDEHQVIENRPLLLKSLITLTLVIGAFLTHDLHHIEPATLAMAGAALLMLLTDAHDVEEFFREVEWETIFFFIGLFIMVGALVEVGVISRLATLVLKASNGNIERTGIIILWLSGVVSSFVNNIPYVATMIPLVHDMGAVMGDEAVIPLWWALALGSCFGGNGTLIGASANVVSAAISGKNGHKISFLTFTKYGILITVISLIISTIYLHLRYFITAP